MAGAPERGRAILERGFELADQLGTAMARLMVYAALAEISVATGAIHAAFEVIDEPAAIAGTDAQRLLQVPGCGSSPSSRMATGRSLARGRARARCVTAGGSVGGGG